MTAFFFLEKWQKQVSLYMFVTTRDVKNPKEYKPMNDKIRFVSQTYFWPLIVSLYVAYMRIYAQTGISMSEESFNEPRFFHYKNLPMQYLERFFSAAKIKNFTRNKNDIFKFLCSKHTLWVHVRTASARRF